MPTVRDLNCARNTLANAVGISASPIPCNDLSPGIVARPTRQRLRLAIRKEIDHLVSLKVDENRLRSLGIAVPPSGFHFRWHVVHVKTVIEPQCRAKPSTPLLELRHVAWQPTQGQVNDDRENVE